MIKRISILIKYELKHFFGDKGAVILSFVVPAIMAVIFGVTFGGAAGGDIESKKLHFDLVDNDSSEISESIVKACKSDDMVVPEITSEADAYSNVKKGKRAVALIIPAGFGQKVKDGSDAELKIIYDPSNQCESQILQGVLQGLILNSDIGEHLYPQMVEKTMKAQGASDEVITVAKFYIKNYMSPKKDNETENKKSSSTNMMGDDFPIEFKSEQVVGQDVDTTAAYVQAVISSMLIFLLFSVTHTAGTLIKEKRRGTLKRLIVSPLRIEEILIGKLLGITILGIIEVYFMLIVGWIIFGLQIWDFPFQLFLMASASALMASGLGIMLTGLAKTEEQVSMLATLVIITISAVGGTMVPRFFMPEFMQKIGYISPVSWAVDGFHNVFWRHLGITGMLTEFGVLIGFSILFLMIGIILVRKGIKSWN